MLTVLERAAVRSCRRQSLGGTQCSPPKEDTRTGEGLLVEEPIRNARARVPPHMPPHVIESSSSPPLSLEASLAAVLAWPPPRRSKLLLPPLRPLRLNQPAERAMRVGAADRQCAGSGSTRRWLGRVQVAALRARGRSVGLAQMAARSSRTQVCATGSSLMSSNHWPTLSARPTECCVGRSTQHPQAVTDLRCHLPF